MILLCSVSGGWGKNTAGEHGKECNTRNGNGDIPLPRETPVHRVSWVGGPLPLNQIRVFSRAGIRLVSRFPKLGVRLNISVRLVPFPTVSSRSIFYFDSIIRSKCLSFGYGVV
ncbi:hypothetical protein I7I50_07897 [Histoplasma capsulatum G186AR]|uniref:Uncharacterized protein n=1 Tax=Ajellomyces capsulatus TaxID=5037 RepID=A0A8H8CVC0_AJECA|nr:hypothetical protein I7I52_08413 [Histoplasma capsulatum]QSS68470.1 hypothetical protein I7I50_07897 [Histoplasma capsulatum G186AR]